MGLMKWNEWKGPDARTPVMFIKYLIEGRDRRLDLHYFVQADREGCFHTHPAICVRVVLRGGYVEEVMRPDGTRYMRTIRPGHIGLVRPSYCHRVAKLLDSRGSWSLWYEGKKTHTVRLLGEGWPENVRGRSDAEHYALQQRRNT